MVLNEMKILRFHKIAIIMKMKEINFSFRQIEQFNYFYYFIVKVTVVLVIYCKF